MFVVLTQGHLVRFTFYVIKVYQNLTGTKSIMQKVNMT